VLEAPVGASRYSRPVKLFAVRIVVALPFGAVLACGALTSGSIRDAGEDMELAPAQDGGGRPDSTAGSGSSGADAASLTPSCAAVLTCCPVIPQVQLGQCTAVVMQNTESACSTLLGEYLFDGYISDAHYMSDAGCVGSPPGMSACSTLSECCSSGDAPSECIDVANAGNGPACASYYGMIWGEYCGFGPGP